MTSRLWVAELYARAGLHQRALPHFELLLASGSVHADLAHCGIADAYFLDLRVGAHVHGEWACHAMQDHITAEQHYRKCLELNPSNAGARVSLAKLLSECYSDYAAAKEHLEYAQRLPATVRVPHVTYTKYCMHLIVMQHNAGLVHGHAQV